MRLIQETLIQNFITAKMQPYVSVLDESFSVMIIFSEMNVLQYSNTEVEFPVDRDLIFMR